MADREATTPDEILAAALAREEEARDLYTGLANNAQVDIVRELLEKLKDEESRHVHMIQNLIATLNLGKNIA